MNLQQRLRRLETSRTQHPVGSARPELTILAQELRDLGLDPGRIIVDGCVHVDGDKEQFVGTLMAVCNTADPGMQNYTAVLEFDPREGARTAEDQEMRRPLEN